MALPVQVDSDVIEITVWTRGVTLAKEGRDTVTLLATAGKSEGKHTQSFDNYVDLPDRIGVACKSYARISESPIESFYEYENHRPDVIVLVEETLVKGHDYLNGAKPGCVVVVNTAREPEALARWLEPKERLPLVKALATIDANSFGVGVTLTFDGTEGAADGTAIGAGVGAAIAGAAAKASGCVALASLLDAAENQDAVQQGWDNVKILPLCDEKAYECEAPVDRQEIGWGYRNRHLTFKESTGGRSMPKSHPQVPFAAIVPCPTTENDMMVTGNWRYLRPVVDRDACTKCKMCWIMCPDTCVVFDEAEGVSFNLKYCKGCGICSSVCPVEAISRVPELDCVE